MSVIEGSTGLPHDSRQARLDLPNETGSRARSKERKCAFSSSIRLHSLEPKTNRGHAHPTYEIRVTRSFIGAIAPSARTRSAYPLVLEICAYVALDLDSVSANLRRWLPLRRPLADPARRLLCFPHAGAGASSFSAWSRLVDDDTELCAVQLPGRETRVREAPRHHLESLCTEVVDALAPLLDRPYALLGHSMGAPLALAVARACTDRQRPPALVVVSAFAAPHLDRADDLHDLPDAALLEALGRLSGTPLEILTNAEMIELLLPALRADLRACESYRTTPGEPLPCPILALWGRDDSRASEEQMAQWARYTTSFALEGFDGGHFFIHEHARAVLELVHRAFVGAATTPAPSRPR